MGELGATHRDYMMDFLAEDGFMVAWTPAGINFVNGPADAIAVGPWPDVTGWADRYMMTTGSCDAGFQNQGPEEKAQQLQSLFVDLVLGSGLNPLLVHREFRKLEIWRNMKIDMPSGTYVPYSTEGKWSPYIP